MDLVGRSATTTYAVTEADTAAAVGSGSLPVLGTPRLVAWWEATTCVALEEALTEGATSVGTRVDIEHLAATPVGGTVTCEVVVTGQVSRAVTFAVTAHDQTGQPVGRGTITRVVIDADRFLARLDDLPDAPDAPDADSMYSRTLRRPGHASTPRRSPGQMPKVLRG